MLYATVKPLPRLLLLGAGLDAVPLVNMGAGLGWRVTVVDHRPAYLEREPNDSLLALSISLLCAKNSLIGLPTSKCRGEKNKRAPHICA